MARWNYFVSVDFCPQAQTGIMTYSGPRLGGCRAAVPRSDSSSWVRCCWAWAVAGPRWFAPFQAVPRRGCYEKSGTALPALAWCTPHVPRRVVAVAPGCCAVVWRVSCAFHLRRLLHFRRCVVCEAAFIKNQLVSKFKKMKLTVLGTLKNWCNFYSVSSVCQYWPSLCSWLKKASLLKLIRANKTIQKYTQVSQAIFS